MLLKHFQYVWARALLFGLKIYKGMLDRRDGRPWLLARFVQLANVYKNKHFVVDCLNFGPRPGLGQGPDQAWPKQPCRRNHFQELGV